MVFLKRTWQMGEGVNYPSLPGGLIITTLQTTVNIRTTTNVYETSPTQTPLSHVPPLRHVHSELCVATFSVQLGPFQPSRQTRPPVAGSHV